MEDLNMLKIKSVSYGVNKELYTEYMKDSEKLMAGAIEKILIVNSDKSYDVIDLSDYSYEERIAEWQRINKNVKSQNINAKTLFIEDLEKVVEKYTKKENAPKHLKAKKAATFAVGAGLGAALAMATPTVSPDVEMEKTEEDVKEDIPEVPSMEGQDWSYYQENALENNQKTAFNNRIHAWLTSTNGKEVWQNVTLTEEQMEEYGITDPECLYGFTAEDAYSLLLRFGNYTNEEYMTITGGNNIDVVSITDDSHSMSNGALSKIISYYVLSDECNLDIENLINFSEAELAKIEEIEGLFNEFKALIKEDKKEEAEAKMQEIKAWFNEYANDIDFEQDNAKSYILRTMLPSASILSQIYGYKDTITINLYNTQAETYVDKEIKTALFDEIMMRRLVLGYEDFDSVSFLKEHNVSTSKYSLTTIDVSSSIADQFCSAQSDKLTQANTYMSELRSENLTAESAYLATININLENGNIGDQVATQVDNLDNVNTKYDELIYGTYNPELLIEMLNKDLVNSNLYPKNMEYFNKYAIAELNIQYAETNGVTQGKPGDTIVVDVQPSVPVTEETLSESDAVVLDQEGNVTTPEQAMAEARNEHVQSTGILDASTPELEQKAEEQAQVNAANRAVFLQGVYDATFNYYAGESIRSTTTSYDAGWANSSDADVRSQYANGQADGTSYKNAKAQTGTFGGQTTINPEYQDAEIYSTPQAPVESVDNRTEQNETVVETPTETPVETITPTPEINYLPGMEDAEIEGDIVIGEPTPAPAAEVQTTNETSEITNDPTASNGFAPVVDPSTINTSGNGEITYFTEEEIIASISDEEWEQLITPVETEDTNEIGYTR